MMAYLLPSDASITFKVRAALNIAIFIHQVLEENTQLRPPFGLWEEGHIGVDSPFVVVRQLGYNSGAG